MMIVNDKSDLITTILNLILEDAKEKRKNAGMAGSWNDNGASDFERQVKIYRHGMSHTIPEDWEKYETQARKILKKKSNESDPEYQRYLALKKKFED